MNIDGTTALITGGASGLGVATVRRFVEAGAAVVILDLPTSIEKSEPAPGIIHVGGDVTSPEDVQRAIDTVDTSKPLRIVVDCAGIAPARKVLSSKVCTSSTSSARPSRST